MPGAQQGGPAAGVGADDHGEGVVGDLDVQALGAKPVWSALPAVKAGQVTPWDAVPRFSRLGAAPLLEDLAKAVQGAKKLG